MWGRGQGGERRWGRVERKFSRNGWEAAASRAHTCLKQSYALDCLLLGVAEEYMGIAPFSAFLDYSSYANLPAFHHVRGLRLNTKGMEWD